VSRRTFERVTGPKADFWLAQTVGVLVTGIGGVLLLGEKRGRLTPEIELLGAASAAGLGLVDLVFALRGRISKVYLADAAADRRNEGAGGSRIPQGMRSQPAPSR
jgi:hypothetical protein